MREERGRDEDASCYFTCLLTPVLEVFRVSGDVS